MMNRLYIIATIIVSLISLLSISTSYAGNLNSDLLTAAKQGDTNQVRDLLDRGADVNAKHKGGQTALMYAGFKGHIDTIKVLLDKRGGRECKRRRWLYSLNVCERKGLHRDC